MPQDKDEVKKKVKEEKDALDIKATDLIAFIQSADFQPLDHDHKYLLIEQFGLMKRYSVVLQSRLDKLK
jgi:hypothetical protein